MADLIEKVLKTTIQLRNDTTANWNESVKSGKKLRKGEPGIEWTTSGKPKIKVGNGIDTWDKLPYVSGSGGGSSCINLGSDDTNGDKPIITEAHMSAFMESSGSSIYYNDRFYVPVYRSGNDVLYVSIDSDKQKVYQLKIDWQGGEFFDDDTYSYDMFVMDIGSDDSNGNKPSLANKGFDVTYQKNPAINVKYNGRVYNPVDVSGFDDVYYICFDSLENKIYQLNIDWSFPLIYDNGTYSYDMFVMDVGSDDSNGNKPLLTNTQKITVEKNPTVSLKYNGKLYHPYNITDLSKACYTSVNSYDNNVYYLEINWVNLTISNTKVTSNVNESTLVNNYVNKNTLGAASGVATLDTNAKIVSSQLPDYLLGQVLYGGTIQPDWREIQSKKIVSSNKDELLFVRIELTGLVDGEEYPFAQANGATLSIVPSFSDGTFAIVGDSSDFDQNLVKLEHNSNIFSFSVSEAYDEIGQEFTITYVTSNAIKLIEASGIGVRAFLTSNAKTRLGATEDSIILTNDNQNITGYGANEGIYYIAVMDLKFAGIDDIYVGDWLISNGSSWQKIDNTDAVKTVAGRTGNVTLTIGDIGGLSTELDGLHQNIGNKVEKIDGKGLSTNDFTNDLKTKLLNLNPDGEGNVQSDWNETSTNSDAYILNKPSSMYYVEGNTTAETNKPVWFGTNASLPVGQSTDTYDIGTVINYKIGIAPGESHTALSINGRKTAAVILKTGEVLTQSNSNYKVGDVIQLIFVSTGNTSYPQAWVETGNNPKIEMPEIPEQVQSDWNESTSTSDAYIKNKPSSMYYVTGNTQVVANKSIWHGTNSNMPGNYSYGTIVNYKIGVLPNASHTTLNINDIGAKCVFLKTGEVLNQSNSVYKVNDIIQLIFMPVNATVNGATVNEGWVEVNHYFTADLDALTDILDQNATDIYNLQQNKLDKADVYILDCGNAAGYGEEE